jgi:hypothetical protein
VRVGSGEGLQIGLQGLAHSPGSAEADWQYFLPCSLYNRNDSDGDGKDDYLGTFKQDLRDDKNGSLAAMARNSAAGASFSIARVSLPTFDTAVTGEQLLERDFVQSTDIGSLAPSSESPTSKPRTSQRPSAVTPVAITTAWETTRWLTRALQ